MLLSSLLERVVVTSVSGPLDRSVGKVRDRDSDVANEDVFVAIRGQRFDGHDRLTSMAHAAAVVVDREGPVAPGPTVVRVADTRVALPWLAAAAEGNPGSSMPVVAVTGTNGKTSITFLLAAMARACGLKVGIIGTTGHWIDGHQLPASHTTPDAVTTQALLAAMRDAGCGLVAMEASSIGIAARRVDAIPFRAGIFTNLTRDHLDWHGTMEAYAAAKARLFHELVDGWTILNGDDPAAASMDPRQGRTWYCSTEVPADLSATVRRTSWDGSDVDADLNGELVSFRVPLVGLHNVQNALGALGAARALGLPLDACLRGLEAFTGVPGRLQRVPNALGIGVFIDYAHTDDALKRVLLALRSLQPRRILTVFGCGGDRDRGKRPLMGAAAAAESDLCVVTSDNPRSEDPMAIIAEILPGIGGAAHRVEPDRRAAIALALSLAEPGDIVLVAGKGHEATQTIGGVVTPFDDAAVTAELLAEASPSGDAAC